MKITRLSKALPLFDIAIWKHVCLMQNYKKTEIGASKGLPNSSVSGSWILLFTPLKEIAGGFENEITTLHSILFSLTTQQKNKIKDVIPRTNAIINIGYRTFFIISLWWSVNLLLLFRLKYVKVSINLIITPSTNMPILRSSNRLPIFYSSIISFLYKTRWQRRKFTLPYHNAWCRLSKHALPLSSRGRLAGKPGCVAAAFVLRNMQCMPGSTDDIVEPTFKHEQTYSRLARLVETLGLHRVWALRCRLKYANVFQVF